MRFQGLSQLYLVLRKMNKDNSRFCLCECGGCYRTRSAFRQHARRRGGHDLLLQVWRCYTEQCPLNNEIYGSWERMQEDHQHCTGPLEAAARCSSRTQDLVHANAGRMVEARDHPAQSAIYSWRDSDEAPPTVQRRIVIPSKCQN